MLCLPRNLHFQVHQVLCLPRNLHFEVHQALHLPRICASRFRKRCTCHEICTSRFTKCCACHEICTSRFTKCCACHEICTSRFTKCCACHEICTSRFTKRCTCHEICTSRFTKCCTCNETCKRATCPKVTIHCTCHEIRAPRRSPPCPKRCTCHENCISKQNSSDPLHLSRKVATMYQNAHGATTRAQSPEAPAAGPHLFVSLRSRSAHYIDNVERHECTVNSSELAGHARALQRSKHQLLFHYRKNPSVCPHCLGKNATEFLLIGGAVFIHRWTGLTTPPTSLLVLYGRLTQRSRMRRRCKVGKQTSARLLRPILSWHKQQASQRTSQQMTQKEGVRERERETERERGAH